MAAPVEGVVHRCGVHRCGVRHGRPVHEATLPAHRRRAGVHNRQQQRAVQQRLQHNLHVQHVWPTDPGSVQQVGLACGPKLLGFFEIASSVFPRFRRRKALGLNFFQPRTGVFFSGKLLNFWGRVPSQKLTTNSEHTTQNTDRASKDDNTFFIFVFFVDPALVRRQPRLPRAAVVIGRS